MRRGLDLVVLPLSAILLGVLSCTAGAGLSPATATPVPTQTFQPTDTPHPTSTPQPTKTPTRAPTTTPRPTLTSTPACLSPAEVTVGDKGSILVVCGEVTDEGQRSCPSCPYGIYSYLDFGYDFLIISYDWNFDPTFEGLCLKVSDKVEVVIGRPVFVFGVGEGYAGSQCTHDADGSLHCELGQYFQDYTGCR